ncbi:hypothetical protein L6267_04505 [Candidatus Parcubacteria bacterium]|nr:hypothetical protein [Candidatus Parcubacteria bacterium]
MSKKNKFLLFLAITILIIAFTPMFGNLYEEFLGPTSSGFWGPSHPEYISGFFISYAFFIPLLVIVFGGKRKYKICGVLLAILFFIDIGLGVWEDFIINVGVAIIGWLLAQGILLIKKKSK